MLSSSSGRNQSTFFLAGRQRLQLTQTLIIIRLNKLLELTTGPSGRPWSADLLTPFRFVSLKVFTYISSFDPLATLEVGTEVSAGYIEAGAHISSISAVPPSLFPVGRPQEGPQPRERSSC